MRRTDDSAWLIEQEGFDPSRERELESIFTLANGYLGVRSSSDLPIPASQGDLFVAGIYSRKIITLPYSETTFLTDGNRASAYSELVPFPSPFRLAISTEAGPLELASEALLRHERALDLKQGVLFGESELADPRGGRIGLRSLRCVSLDDPHLLIQELELVRAPQAGTLDVDLSMAPSDFHLNHPHLQIQLIENRGKPCEVFGFVTQASGYCVGLASRVFVDGREADAPRFALETRAGERIRILRLVSVFSSREVADPVSEARRHLLSKDSTELENLLGAHARRWQRCWERMDVRLPGEAALTQAQRFNNFQLRAAASPRSVGARLLSGRAYEGHIFWDAEVFMFPFYLYTEPELARQLLCYRHETLPGARARAQAMGAQGACFAWESTVTGEDVTPTELRIRDSNIAVPIATGREQLHVTADIAHAVWLYWDATLDEDFLSRFGAELLVESARFWASRVTREGASFHLERVIGPDEYHIDVTDNAFTNWMVRLNLRRAVWVCEWLRARGERELARPEEVAAWRDVAERLFVPRPGPDGVIEQFSGYFALEDVRPERGERLRPPISRLSRWAETNRQKIIKQADVLMIPFLFPGAFSPEALRANYLYYEPRTDHGSSLSPAVHAAIAARCGLWDEAERYWRDALSLDLENAMKNTALGLHGGCMGAAWQALIFHFLGVEAVGGALRLRAQPSSSLPAFCRDARFKLFYRQKEFQP